MKTHQYRLPVLLACAFLLLSSFIILNQNKPVLYLVGDSTVKNKNDKGDGSLWGWGHFLGAYFDAEKISVENRALGGTSTRSYQNKGLWERVLVKIKKGDCVMIQFGHNESAPLTDTAKSRGSLRGIGLEVEDVYNPQLKRQETVHTYGWYLSKMVKEAKAKGAEVIVCSLIPRNIWKDGKVVRSENSYGQWAAAVAKESGAYFIDLNAITGDKYDVIGAEKVNTFFPGDHTHTNEAGAALNAASVVDGIKMLKKSTLNSYLLK